VRGGSSGVGGTTAAAGSAQGGVSAAGATAKGGTTGSGGSTAKGGASGSGGSTAKGGTTSSGGGTAKGGATSSGGATGTGGATSGCSPWPAATSTQSVSATIAVSGTYDGGLKRYVGTGSLGTSGQSESQDPIFDLASGATLKNVIIGNPAADGIHCAGTCTLQNVWWEDVGEDAATLKGSSSSQTMTIDCGGAKAATDKVFQHNGPGTMIIKNFWVSDFGKLYRSCGNCSSQYARHVQMTNITASNGSILAGVNTNYGDSAEFHNITVTSVPTICERYTGNNTGAEPPATGSGADGKYCIYAASDIH
jgi:hypothetical protein